MILEITVLLNRVTLFVTRWLAEFQARWSLAVTPRSPVSDQNGGLAE